MNTIELLFLAVGLSMDAFAVAVGTGLSMKKALFSKMLVVGLYFGAFQALAPLAGYAAATLFAAQIIAYDHWVAFALLCFLGGKMTAGSFKKNLRSGQKDPEATHGGAACPEASLKPGRMLPLAFATSVDALAVGVSFAFLRVSLIPAVSLIGAVTLVISMAGVKIGSVSGAALKTKAEFAGGVLLVLIGAKILLEHLLG